ncbi:MAG: hypothetical protein AB8F94_14915 [Saprospiraceae bacterium]
MKNSKILKHFFAGQLLQNDDLQNIKGGKRSHSEKLENRRIKRGGQQLRKLLKESIKLERKLQRSSRNY